MNEETKETFTPIFVGENNLAKTECMRNLRFQFNKSQQFVPLIKDANLPITHDIVMDCLTITKAEHATYPTDENGKVSKYGTMSYVYKNCPHIDAEFAKMAQAATEGKPKIIADKERAEIASVAETFKESVFNVFANLGKDSRESTKEMQRYVLVDGGEIKLPEDIEERVAHDTGVWCETEAQAQALEAHRQAANAVRDFLALFPRQYWPHSTAELGNLFKFGEDGAIQPQMIDYSLFI